MLSPRKRGVKEGGFRNPWNPPPPLGPALSEIHAHAHTHAHALVPLRVGCTVRVVALPGLVVHEEDCAPVFGSPVE